GDGEVPVLERRTEVPAQQPAEIAAELHVQRLVEVIRLTQVRLDLRRQRAFLVERPPGGEPHHEERERDQDEERRNRTEQAAQRVTEQRVVSGSVVSGSNR